MGKNLCDQCPTPGICCLREDTAMGKRIAVDEMCPFLDFATKKCSIYRHRHKNPECLSVEKMIELGTCPKWCLYVKDNAEYQARTNTRLYKYKIVEE